MTNRILLVRSRLVLVCLAMLASLMLLACGDEDGGSIVFEGPFEVSLTVRDTASGGGPPLLDDCIGDVTISRDLADRDMFTGLGQCLTTANAASYTLDGEFTSGGDFEGDLVITFSAVLHNLTFQGSLVGNTMEATFAGTTSQVGAIVIDWDGDFGAVGD